MPLQQKLIDQISKKIFSFKIIAKFVKKWPKIAHFFRNFVILMKKIREFEISDLLTI